MKQIILCIVLFFPNCIKGQPFRTSDPGSFDGSSSLNSGMFGELNESNRTLPQLNQFLNPITNFSNSSEGESFGLKNQDNRFTGKDFNSSPTSGDILNNDNINNNKNPSLIDNNNFNNENNDRKIDIKLFGLPQDFPMTQPQMTVTPINSMDFASQNIVKADLFQNFFVSGTSNGSEDFILKNENHNSHFDSGSNGQSFGSSSIPKNSSPLAIDNPQLTKESITPSIINPGSLPIETVLPTNNFKTLDTSPSEVFFGDSVPSNKLTIPSSNSHLLSNVSFETFPSSIQSNFTDSNIKSENKATNTNPPINHLQDDNSDPPFHIITLNEQVNNTSEMNNLNNQGVSTNSVAPTITPIVPIFGNPTPNGWIPQTMPPFSIEKPFQEEKLIPRLPDPNPADNNQTVQKDNEDKKNFNQNMSFLEGNKFLPNSDITSDFQSLPPNQTFLSIPNMENSTQMSPKFNQPNLDLNQNNAPLTDNINQNQKDPSNFNKLFPLEASTISISDQAIFNQSPPRFGNDKVFPSSIQDNPFLLTGTSRELYNSSLNSDRSEVNPPSNQTLSEIIQNVGLTTFLHYLEITGLTSILKNEGTFTVFAPSNKAFDIMPDTVKEDLQSHLDKLRSIINFHIANGIIVSGDFKNELIIPSMSMGKEIRINLFSINETLVLTASGCPINVTNVFASNGVIHILDKVMFRTPDFNIVGAITSLTKFNQLSSAVSLVKLQQVLAGGPFTFFAPTELAFQKLPIAFLENILKNETALEDILNYHLVYGTYYTEGLIGGATLKTVNNKTLTVTMRFGFYKVNNATISEADITVTNGVLHSTDSLLLPPNFSME